VSLNLLRIAGLRGFQPSGHDRAQLAGTRGADCCPDGEGVVFGDHERVLVLDGDGPGIWSEDPVRDAVAIDADLNFGFGFGWFSSS
jgi:hypothetical protein